MVRPPEGPLGIAHGKDSIQESFKSATCHKQPSERFAPIWMVTWALPFLIGFDDQAEGTSTIPAYKGHGRTRPEKGPLRQRSRDSSRCERNQGTTETDYIALTLERPETSRTGLPVLKKGPL